MTGSLIVQPTGQDLPSHTRNILLLQDGFEVCFADPRNLGSMRVVEDEASLFRELAPEPLDPVFTPKALADRLSGKAAPIKALLCDQALVAGIGNIYADEALRQRLTEDIAALEPMAGSVSPPTESESGLQQLLVPRSEWEPCTRCGCPIRRRTVRGRGT